MGLRVRGQIRRSGSRAFALALCALLALSGVQCVQDFVSADKPPVYAFTVSPITASLNIGDTVAPFTGVLTVDGRAASFRLGLSLIDSNGTLRLDSLGRLIVLARGFAKLEARALGPQLQAGAISETLTVQGVVPRIGLATARSTDTLTSLGDSLTLFSSALSTHGDTIRGVPIAWSTVSGGTSASLLDPTTGRIRAATNGSALFRASVDNVTADRPVVVRQRPAALVPALDTLILRALGEVRHVSAIARDARANPIGGAVITWTSTGTAVATVDAGGFVTAQGEGSAQVVARTPLSATDSLSAPVRVIVARARLRISSGDAQAGTVGATVSPLVVQLIDSLGATVPESGIPIVFRAATAGTKVSGADSVVVQTDALGQASAALTLSTTAGANQVPVAGQGLAGAALTFNATGAPSTLASMASVSGAGQSGTVGANLAAGLVVALRDSYGNGIAGQRVVFRVTAGGGKIAGLDTLAATTDSLGRASAVLTLGTASGANQVVASSAAPSGSPVTFTATGVPGAPRSLVFTGQPGSGSAGNALTPMPQVTVRDTFGNTVTTAGGQVSLALAPATANGASLAGTATVTPATGVAAFASVSIPKAGAGYRLVATSGGLFADTSGAFDITASSADHLAFTVQPGRTAAGSAMAPSIEVTVQDALGNRVAGASNLVTLSLGTTPFGGGGLFGTLQVSASNGVAVFSDARISKVGAGYRLVAQTGSLVAATSAFFDVVAGASVVIAKVSGDNQNQVPGAPLDQPLVAQLRDSFDNVVPGDTIIFKAIAGGGHFGALDSALAVTNAQGNASAQYTLGASPGANTVEARIKRVPATTVTFTSSATAAGLHLTFTVGPSNAAGGAQIAPSVKVAVQDGSSVTQTSATTIVTLTLQGGTSGASLSGTVSVAAVNGVATFSNLSVDKAGTGYQLVAAASGVNGAASAPFDIAVGPSARLRFAASPSAATAGADFGAVQVRIEDLGGNLVTSASDLVTIALDTGTSGAHLRGTVSAPASGGLAQLVGLSIDSAGAVYRLRASDGAVQAATSTSFAVSPAPASRLAFTAQPSAVTAGAAIAPAIRVAVRDSLGNAVPTATPTLTLGITGGTGTAGAVLSGGSANAQGGVASFGSVSLNRSGTGYTLTASGPGLAQATSAPFDVTSAAASRLGFVTEPTGAAAGQSIAPAVRVAVEDGFGNVVTGGSASISMEIVSGTGNPAATLSGTRTAGTTGGIATFGNLSIDKVGSGYTLRANASGLTVATSAAFAITPAAAESLVVVSGNNQNGLAGGTLAAPFVVAVRDHFGNAIAGFGVLFKVTAGGGTFGPADSALATTDGSGLASATLTLGPGTANNTAEARASGLVGSPQLFTATVTPVGAKLGFLTQPSGATAGVTLAPQVRVAVQASDNSTVTTATSLITLSLVGGTSGAHLRGTKSVSAVNGIATFDVSVDSAGAGYTLSAASPGLTGATSGGFAITPAPPARLGFVVQPANTPFNGTISPAVRVAVQDSLGNTASSAASVAMALTSGSGTPGATLSGTTPVTAVGGVASFGDLKVSLGGNGYTLAATSSGLLAATSTPFNIFGGPARLAFTAAPATTTAGAALAPVPQVTVLDANGNLVSDATTSITLALAGGTAGANLSGTRTLGAVNGVASFSGLSVDSAGAYRLAASGGGLTPDTTAVFDVIPGAPVRLAFTVQPSSRTAGSAITPAVQVAVRDAIGNQATSATSVAIAIVAGTGAPGATLSGTTSVTASGLAAFSDLSIDRAATGYRLAVSSSGLVPDTSIGFSIAVGPLASVVVTPGTPALASLGATVQLAAEGRDGSGNALSGQTFTWGSSNAGVATVSGSGLVTAIANGSAVITATDNGIAGTATVTVTQLVASVSVSPGTAQITALGNTQQFSAVARDANGNAIAGKTFTWGSGTTSVATVDAAGLATAVANGTSQITATSDGVPGSASLTVAQAVASVSVAPPSASLTAFDQAQQFTAAAFDANGNAIAGAVFTWSSDATGVATVNAASGLATAVGNGAAQITASAGGHSASGSLTVGQVTNSVVVTPATAQLGAFGSARQFAAQALDANLHPIAGKMFTWSSDDASASVNASSGLATSVGNGTAHITASVDGKSGSATLTIAQVVASVAVTPTPVTLTALGATQQLAATAFDSNANAMSRTFTWSSDAPSVASVGSTTGLVTAVNNGTAHVSATTDGIAGSATVTVAQTVKTVTVGPGTSTLASFGDTQQLTAIGRDSLGSVVSGATFTWGTSDGTIAGVNGSGLVTAAGNGTATITASSGGHSGTASVTVTQVTASVVVTPTPVTLTAFGDTQQLAAQARDQRGNVIASKTAFVWSSGATGIATVNASTGLVTAVANGGATISAVVDGVTGSASITVAQATASVTVSPATYTIGAIGSTKAFAATALDSRGNAIVGKTFTWSSDATGVATVGSSTGVATAVTNGTAQITATVDAHSGSATLTVAQVTKTVTVAPTTPTDTAVGQLKTFTATARDSNNNVVAAEAIGWTSSNTGTATINSSSGISTAVANGSTTITATASNGVQGTTTLTVQQIVTTVEVTPNPQAIPVLSSRTFTATAYDANHVAVSGIAFTWASSNTLAVTVTANNPSTTASATRTALTNSVTITATSQGGGSGGSNVAGTATAN